MTPEEMREEARVSYAKVKGMVGEDGRPTPYAASVLVRVTMCEACAEICERLDRLTRAIEAASGTQLLDVVDMDKPRPMEVHEP